MGRQEEKGGPLMSNRNIEKQKELELQEEIQEGQKQVQQEQMEQTESKRQLELKEQPEAKAQSEGSNRCCHCMEKHTLRSEEQKKALINRLKRIEGQVRGVQQMLEKDAYCNDILVQSAAISAAMNAFNKEILATHIHTCVVRDIREGRDEVVDELVSTIQKLMK